MVVVVEVVAVCLSIYLSICPYAICKLDNKAILQDFLSFEIDDIKNAAILRDFFQIWKVDQQNWVVGRHASGLDW